MFTSFYIMAPIIYSSVCVYPTLPSKVNYVYIQKGSFTLNTIIILCDIFIVTLSYNLFYLQKHFYSKNILSPKPLWQVNSTLSLESVDCHEQ